MPEWPRFSHWPLPQLLTWMLEAGRCAMEYYQQVKPEAKEDGSLVTQADREIEARFASHLDHPDEGWYLIGEESEAAGERSPDYLAAALKETLFVVDPIDGTAPFANGLPTWGISLGCACRGTLSEGAIYLPVTGKLYVSAGEQVYLLTVVDNKIADRQVLTAEAAAAGPLGMIAVSQDVTKNGSLQLPNPVQALGTAVVPLMELLHGHYLAYSGQLKLWDLAGGLPILQKLGFVATLHNGKPLSREISPEFYELESGHPKRWHLRQPCIFSAPGIADYVLGHIHEG